MVSRDGWVGGGGGGGGGLKRKCLSFFVEYTTFKL